MSIFKRFNKSSNDDLKLIKNWNEELKKEQMLKQKYDINPEDNIPQKVYGVPFFDYGKDKIKVVVDNYYMTLTKQDDKCDLEYTDYNDRTAMKNQVVAISGLQFDDFYERLRSIIADWNMGYDENIVFSWQVNIDVGGYKKDINGRNVYPDNLNELVNLVKEFSRIFQNNLTFESDKNEVTGESFFEEKVKRNMIDSFWADLIINYFRNEVKQNDIVSLVLYNELLKDSDIFNEFTKCLVQKTYDMPGKISVGGYTAAQIAKLNPSFRVIDVYLFLIYLKEKPEEAKKLEQI